MPALDIRRQATPLPEGTAACLGAFDGLHRGHQALLAQARALGGRVALVTFEPHPQRVLAPDRAPPLLLGAAQRERLAATLGVDTLVLLPFDAAMAQMDARTFVRTQLLEGLRPAAVIVGADFRFGAQRLGDVALLGDALAAAGVTLHVVPPVPAPPDVAAGPASASATEHDNLISNNQIGNQISNQISNQFSKKISSSTIREALARGEVGYAAQLLGRPHAVVGEVVHGAKRGRTIGIPTANLGCGDALLPRPGIYAVRVSAWDPAALPELAAPHDAVASLGTNPTFTGTGAPLVLEAHVLDRDLGERLYGHMLQLEFVARLRDEQRYTTVEALVAQIHDDIAHARRELARTP